LFSWLYQQWIQAFCFRFFCCFCLSFPLSSPTCMSGLHDFLYLSCAYINWFYTKHILNSLYESLRRHNF
jgi:hypothetical protein